MKAAIVGVLASLFARAASAGTTPVSTVHDFVDAFDNGDTAYVTMAATYSQKGAAMSEPARTVFALKKAGGDRKITAWAWAGDVPKAR